MNFPLKRLRRLRELPLLRSMVRETQLSPQDFISPLFVCPGRGVRREVPSMPGVFQLSVDQLDSEISDLVSLGIPAVILFGIPSEKDEVASEAYDPTGVVQNAIKTIRDKTGELLVITDVCLCEYTSHGHCGVLKDGRILNDPTLELLGKTALSHAKAGAHMVAPSDMMDGRVIHIRSVLDSQGFSYLPIMAYSVKYASAFYGPFREAAQSTPAFGDRKSHQMDPSNLREAVQEAQLDIAEGADIIMVKPAMAYLDVVRVLRELSPMPLAAYNVSGEYSMVKAAARNGWVDEKKMTLEILTSIKRAGADLILTYHAKDAARWLQEESHP